ncbi:MAG: hypothetical protein ACR2O7_08660 [Parasphingorhabdus sp.]
MAVGDGIVNTGGIEVWLTDDSDTLTKLVGVTKCNRPGFTMEDSETTDQDSGGTKTYKPAMGDIGELSFELKYEPGSPTDLLILEHLASRESRPFKMVAPAEDGTTIDVTANLFLKSYVPDDGSLGNTRVATVSGRPGTLTQAATVGP